MKIKNYLFAFLLIGLYSCAGSKYMESYQDLDRSVSKIAMKDLEQSHETRFRPEDRLLIIVSSIDPNASVMFNLPATNHQRPEEATTITANQNLQTYLVDSQGNIDYPVLGTLHVEGLTPEELKALLHERLKPYFTQAPVITIQLTNFNIYLSGEVTRPGKILISKENITLMEAIISAGDITSNGRKDKVTLIRRTKDDNEIFHFDLTKSESIASQNFLLQQNDLIYIPPTEFKKRNMDETRQTLNIILPVVSAAISAISVVLVAIIK